MTDRQWHYATDGTSIGPRTTPEMQALIAQGAVTGQTLVWTEGMSQWAEAAATELRGFLGARAVPPPPPAVGAAFAALPQAAGPAPWMGFGQAVRYCLGNYVTFSGRGARSQYWFFQLFIYLTLLGLLAVFFLVGGAGDMSSGADEITPAGAAVLAVMGLFYLAMLLPNLASTSRRFHDAGWSFWWILMGFVPYVGGVFTLVLTLLRDPLPNRFGVTR